MQSSSEQDAGATAFNPAIAAMLREIAVLLADQGASPFRVRAYERGADAIEGLETDVRMLVARQGRVGLTNIPFIGAGIAAVIEEYIHTGRASRLDRLRGAVTTDHTFRRVPGIGPVLAQRIADQLHLDTLEGLEIAAHDGRLAALAGVGPRRAAAIRASLASILGRRQPRQQSAEPAVGVLLSVDAQYRREAQAGTLPMITPRRFNRERKAWLPVLHTDRGEVHFTALYSNTARAHELGHTHDWVVLYFYDDEHHEGQCTVVTETAGPLHGLRVVRGRETACGRYYRERGLIDNPGAPDRSP